MKKTRICIAGGIGAGKSAVSSILRQKGYPVYDSDSNAKVLMTITPEIRERLIEKFGDEVYSNGNLSRQYLASQIFTNEENRNYVESIVHPVVIKDFEEWAAQQASDVVFIESAVPYSSGLSDTVDMIFYISAQTDVRIARIMSRDSCTSEAAMARINAQDEEIKLMQNGHHCKTWTIDNSKDLTCLAFNVGYAMALNV